MAGILGLGGIADDILNNSATLSGITTIESSQTQNATKNQVGGLDGPGGEAILVNGTDSLFNPFTIFRYSNFGSGTSKDNRGSYEFSKHKNLYKSFDILKRADEIKDQLAQRVKDIIQNPSAINIIDWTNVQAARGSDHSGPLYPYPYQLNDFLWCKWYGKIPNNRLLTLRRYPIPIEDNLAISKQKVPLVPIAQAVSWWGEDTSNSLSEILGMTYGFNWKPISTMVEDVQGNELKAEALIDALAIKDETLKQTIKLAIGSIAEQNPFAFSGYDETIKQFTKDSWEKGAYWNRILGPINVIDSTQIRDRGFDFTHDITITFEYNLRSYGNISPKIAMLDLLSNFLSLTYQRANFWGGATRYFQNTGVLLPFVNTSAMEKGDYVNALKELATALGSGIASGGEAIKEFVDQTLTKMDGKSATEQGAVLATSIAGSSAVQNVVASRMASLHQQPLVMRSFLDGRAVGEWHLMVGNPMDPIAVIGNLCLDKTTITFSDELGADDFPTSIKFVVVLKHGRPRAKQDIESMFNLGGGDLGLTALAEPSSSMNSYGEYNSARLANAYGTSVGVDLTGQAAKFKKDLLISSEQAKGKTLTVENEDGTINSQGAEYVAQYFRTSVANKYGVGFGSSPILVDYFTQLKTKD